jgi:hypothetical protein
MAKVIAKLKNGEKMVNNYSCLKSDIILSEFSKRNGFVKGIVDYGYVPKFGIVRIPFKFAIYDDFSAEGFEDWTYSDGEKIPFEDYIWETIKMLNEDKLLNK